MQGLPPRPSAASADPRGRQAESQTDSAAFSVRACNDKVNQLADMTDTVLGHRQQLSQPKTLAAAQREAHRLPCLQTEHPSALCQNQLIRGCFCSQRPLFTLPEPAQKAPAATLGLQDMLDLLLLPMSHATDENVPSQQLSRPENASGALRTGSAAAGAKQPGAKQQQKGLLAYSLQPDWQKPRPQHAHARPAAVRLLHCWETSFALRMNAWSAWLPGIAPCWHPVATCPIASSVQSSCAAQRAFKRSTRDKFAGRQCLQLSSRHSSEVYHRSTLTKVAVIANPQNRGLSQLTRPLDEPHLVRHAQRLPWAWGKPHSVCQCWRTCRS